jgi:hypothetical protein
MFRASIAAQRTACNAACDPSTPATMALSSLAVFMFASWDTPGFVAMVSSLRRDHG